jgi:mannose-6-phosphate isomerase-like protein (cupin superfamily)
VPSNEPLAIVISDALGRLRFFPDRTPTTAPEQMGEAFGTLTTYRNGAVTVGHWAGSSEWEHHGGGDELVMVLEGETTIFFLSDGDELGTPLGVGELVLVPEGTWHRFETPEGVKLLSITPQPSDHRPTRPD